MDDSEPLAIEKMRRFYEFFPYPNRPFFLSPKIVAHFSAHGAFSSLMANENWEQAKRIELSAHETLNKIFDSKNRILLVGCGTDEPLLFRLLHPNNEIVAIDLSQISIAKAKRKIYFQKFMNIIFHWKKIKKIEFITGNAINILKIKELNSFDFIQCFGVLHHQPNPILMFMAMARTLKNGGILRLMVYSHYGRKLERRIQSRYKNIWDGIVSSKYKKYLLVRKFFLLRLWQILNFFGLFPSTSKRFAYLGSSSATVADALLHPSDPGLLLSDVIPMAEKCGLHLCYCEGKIEDEGKLKGFEHPMQTWNSIVIADEKQMLLSNPILIFKKVVDID